MQQHRMRRMTDQSLRDVRSGAQAEVARAESAVESARISLYSFVALWAVLLVAAVSLGFGFLGVIAGGFAAVVTVPVLLALSLLLREISLLRRARRRFRALESEARRRDLAGYSR